MLPTAFDARAAAWNLRCQMAEAIGGASDHMACLHAFQCYKDARRVGGRGWVGCPGPRCPRTQSFWSSVFRWQDEVAIRQPADPLCTTRHWPTLPPIPLQNGRERGFCAQNFISPSTMAMVDGMRGQLASELQRLGFIRDVGEASSSAADLGLVRAVLVSVQGQMMRPGMELRAGCRCPCWHGMPVALVLIRGRRTSGHLLS